ncbi:MAG: recombinase family protein, partial [Albidovulum sp.]|uniref:recombinase family protein n=1 Tax=Albidovulum sp. TaxID=1872424 RepID=UPI003C92A221
MKTCYGYIRVSTQTQGEGVSLEAQKDAITAFASHNKIKLIAWFEEKETAAKSGRPIFNQMIRQLMQGKASGLIMHKIDRSARNLGDWAVISDLSDRGIDVHFATESLDFRSRGGRLTADIQAVIAADYVRNLREETLKGMRGRMKQGLYPWGAPLGYLNNGGGKPKTMCPVTGPLVREALHLYATGGYSFRTLRSKLDDIGLRNRSGGKMTKQNIEAMLRNPFYCGLIVAKRTGEVHQGIHDPLISTRTFRRIQEIKAGRAGKKVTRHNHLYRGLFRCGLCDAALSPELQKGHVYYRCQTRGCPTTTIREERIDEAIRNALNSYQLTDEAAEHLRIEWLAWLKGNEHAGALKSIDLRIEQVEAKLERLTDLMIDGTIDAEDFSRRKQSFLLEQSEL